MNIIIFHQPFPMGNYKINETIAKHFKNKGNVVYYVEQLNGTPVTNEYIDVIKELKPDLVYYEMLDRETFKVIEELNCEKILSYTSKGILKDEYELTKYKNKWFTKISTNSESIGSYLKSEGISVSTYKYCWSPIAEEDLIYNENYKHDCVFLGMGFSRLQDKNYSIERDMFYTGFNNNIDFKIYGNGWPNFQHYKGILPENDIGSLYYNAKSAVSQIGLDQRNKGRINNRYTEIMFCECPLLTYKYPTVEWGEAEEHILFVGSKQEMYDNIIDIKNNPDKYKRKTKFLKNFIIEQDRIFFENFDKFIGI